MFTNRLFPIIKWAGGKERELKHLVPFFPEKINNYYEPFVGGGSVYVSINANKLFINDKSSELINLYNIIKSNDLVFFNLINKMVNDWLLIKKIILINENEFINLYSEFTNGIFNEYKATIFIDNIIKNNQVFIDNIFCNNLNVYSNHFIKEIKKNFVSKLQRMCMIESKKGKMVNQDIIDNIESSIKSAYYMHIRFLYNNTEKFKINHSTSTALFFFIRNFAYSGMFRYNKNGDFNVPYGGIGYNNKDLSKKINYFQSKELNNYLQQTEIFNLDFEDFLKSFDITESDFVFLDPPYDTEFSTYAKNEFNKNDQIRLANFLINESKSKWLLVIKNTDFIFNLYNKTNININKFDKKYQVSFQNRNNKEAEHLVIRNYQ